MRDEEYEQNVFINCPFDAGYSSIFEAIVFAVNDAGFRPKCARERLDSSQVSPSESIPGGAAIYARYEAFRSDLPDICAELNLEVGDLTFADFSYTIARWLNTHQT